MITEIIGSKIVVENNRKQSGVYLVSDFDDEELKEEKQILISKLFTGGIEEIEHIYDLIKEINGVLDKRLIQRSSDKYFELAKTITRVPQ